MSNLPDFTIKEMLEAGIHFGHKAMLWNPKMAPFIFGNRSGVHIIDLQKTAALLKIATKVIMDVAKKRGSKILFVGTKLQAGDAVKEAAIKCGQFYVNHRWLGGMLTNWNTVSKSIKTLGELENILKAAETGEETKYNKKELIDIDRKRQKLDNVLGGIRNMSGKPDLLFVIDVNKEKIAVEEAKKLNIPVVGVVDTNSSPDNIDYVIPGNDDATRAIDFYCRIISDTIVSGMEEFLSNSGVDIGEVETPFNQDAKIEQKVGKVKQDAKEVEVLGKSSVSKAKITPTKEVKKITQEATLSKKDDKVEEQIEAKDTKANTIDTGKGE